MDQALDTFYNDGDGGVSVTLTGKFETNSSEMDSYLKESVEYIIGNDMESAGMFITSYVIDTTQTRLSQSLLCIFVLLIGAFFIVAGTRRFRKNDMPYNRPPRKLPHTDCQNLLAICVVFLLGGR